MIRKYKYKFVKRISPYIKSGKKLKRTLFKDNKFNILQIKEKDKTSIKGNKEIT